MTQQCFQLSFAPDARDHIYKHPRVIGRSGKPIVGHNCMYDLMFMFSHFCGALPATLAEFKKRLSALMPLIYDTKYISSMSTEWKDTGERSQPARRQVCMPRLLLLGRFCPNHAILEHPLACTVVHSVPDGDDIVLSSPLSASLVTPRVPPQS